ncbi:YceI family protein [Mangrovivirga sp. M17]|uniref:YceI family protein n=1 Tax=Mangrovivirga halotolerans TaxID=2993936 RepID=A0ABT3RN87_9BACT|nr:YceI family protein [Mangrovivirga halotolerans]MCX2742983.1 YceI family protein [Mangrovivirga halotolerans]
MRNPSRIIGIVLSLLMLTAFNSELLAQYKVESNSSTLSVFGTSSLHDWEIEANTLQGSANFDLSEGLVKDINNLTFSVVVKSLKSGKSGMDNNTYDALEAKKHEKITFKLTDVNKITPLSGGKCKIEATGVLTIAGNARNVKMTVTADASGSKVNIKGSYKMKMTSFDIDPPTAVFGTIKTGDDVKIEFNVNYIK